MKPVNSKSLTQAQQDELSALAALPDDRIDTADIPEVRDWSDARRGLFFRPAKKQLTLRVDADLIAWFKSHTAQGQSYQAIMNDALREYVARHDHQT
jgi:uncharacterized protein (DUF4415 family)